MTVTKSETIQAIMFSDALKNSSNSAEGRKYEVQFGKPIEALALTTKKEELKAKGKDYQPSIYEKGSLYLDNSKSVEEMKHECEWCFHLLKDKYKSEHCNVMQHLTSSVEEHYQEFGVLSKPLPGFSMIQRQI